MKNENNTNGAEAPSSIPSPNVKEHATLSAGAGVDHGIEVGNREEHVNRAADRGCCVSTCSASSFLGSVGIRDKLKYQSYVPDISINKPFSSIKRNLMWLVTVGNNLERVSLLMSSSNDHNYLGLVRILQHSRWFCPLQARRNLFKPVDPKIDSLLRVLIDRPDHFGKENRIVDAIQFFFGALAESERPNENADCNHECYVADLFSHDLLQNVKSGGTGQQMEGEGS